MRQVNLLMRTREKSMVDTAKTDRAWINLGRFVDKGYAIALSKPARNRFHVRAVRSEQVVEAESGTMAEAICDAYDKVNKVAE
jgi:hypothetical protein